MTHYSNLVGIIKNGILPKNKLPNPVYDISNQDVQKRREKLEYIYNRQIHDYVPFYFNPKNPMLYVRRNIQHEIIILAITKSLLNILLPKLPDTVVSTVEIKLLACEITPFPSCLLLYETIIKVNSYLRGLLSSC